MVGEDGNENEEGKQYLVSLLEQLINHSTSRRCSN